MTKEKFPDWFLWLWENLPLVLIGSLVVSCIAVGCMVYLEDRLSDIEDQLTYAPPRSYVAPKLGEYDAGDVTIQKLTDRHSTYVPVYSHIYYRGGSAYSLETTLSIRNVSSSRPIYVESVGYYDTKGELTKTLVDRLIKLEPLQTIEFLIEGRDSSGGSGANFLVRWGALSIVDKPLIETVMVGVAGTQGISFARTGIETSSGN